MGKVDATAARKVPVDVIQFVPLYETQEAERHQRSRGENRV